MHLAGASFHSCVRNPKTFATSGDEAMLTAHPLRRNKRGHRQGQNEHHHQGRGNVDVLEFKMHRFFSGTASPPPAMAAMNTNANPKTGECIQPVFLPALPEAVNPVSRNDGWINAPSVRWS